MLLHVKDAEAIESANRAIRELLNAHSEWFLTQNGGAPIALNSTEFDFSIAHRRLIFSSWTESGSRSWRVTAWSWTGEKLLLEASRRMGAEVAKLELVPRASAKAIVASIAAARQARCEKLAQIVAQTFEGVGGRVRGVDRNDFHTEPKIPNPRMPRVDSSELPPTPNTQQPGSLAGADAAIELHPKPNPQLPQTFEGEGGGVLGVDRNDFHPEPRIPNSRVPRVDSSDLHPKPNTQPPEDHRLKSMLLSAKIERAVLSPGMRRDQPGRYARIVLRLPHERLAVTATVARSDARNIDSLFSSALLWFNRLLSRPQRPPIEKLLVVVEPNTLEAARQRHVLLRESLRQRIELWEIDDDWEQTHPARAIERKALWKKRLTRFPPVTEAETSERAQQIVSQAPQAIDIVNSRHGQTLRYHGLPFVRLRRVMTSDRVWFGIEGSRRRALDEYHERDWAKLFADLQSYRHEDCRDRRHWLYRSAGEAWLESMLRRDITKLDPGLIIAPLHAQFRTSHGGPTGARPIDLLALRHDGRLVVIELKVNEDREHVFQGVDYWRRVEAHRRRGHISKAKLFGDREISDESPLVYLVAPALRFHPSFRTLAKMIAPDVEIYRFDINEDWRGGVRVVRRERVNA